MATRYVGRRPAVAPTSSVTVAADTTRLLAVSVREACDLQAIGFIGGANSAPAKMRGVLYAQAPDGTPGALLGITAERTGISTGVEHELEFPVPIALTPGLYYLGIQAAVGTSVRRQQFERTTVYQGDDSYADGPANPFPTPALLADVHYFWGRYESDTPLDEHTFGRTTAGGSMLNLATLKAATRFTLPEPGTLHRLVIWWAPSGISNAPTAATRGVIYADTGAGPGALLGATAEVRHSPYAEWIDYEFAAPLVLPAGDYYLGAHTSVARQLAFDAAAGDTRTPPSGDTYADGPADPWGTANTSTGTLSVYAVYTPGGAPPATPRVIQPVWIMG